MNNSELIVSILQAAGVSHGFGIPSGNVLPLIEAMRTGGIEYVLTAHEGSASFAADVMARQTGRPGFCLATLGPGATNLATGVGGAYLDRSAMIAITCNLNSDQLGRRLQMLIDHHALFGPITKASLPLRFDNVAETVSRALEIALAEPQGPVHLDLPEDVSLAPAPEGAGVRALEIAPLAAPEAAAVARAGEILGAASLPLAIIGSNAMRLSDPGLLRRVVEHHNLPFLTTTMAKGLIDDDHPLSLGCIERARRQVQRRFVAGADLMVGLGYDTVEVEYEAWLGEVPLLQVDIEPVDVAPSVTVAGEVTGDLAAGLKALLRLPAAGPGFEAASLDAHRRAFGASLRPQSANFTPHEAIDVVRRVLPGDGILAFDVGAHTHQIASQWAAPAPGRFLITNGWSSMGFGLPAAIAAKLAEPGRPVVCVLGDGCFQMTCGEMATAERLGLALPVVVLDDSWLSLIQIKQAQRQYGLYGSGLREEAYGEPPAHYFGAPATGVRDGPALAAALERALAADGPTVIEAVVDGEHYRETVFD